MTPMRRPLPMGAEMMAQSPMTPLQFAPPVAPPADQSGGGMESAMGGISKLLNAYGASRPPQPQPTDAPITRYKPPFGSGAQGNQLNRMAAA